jgi:hypothetical protein
MTMTKKPLLVVLAVAIAAYLPTNTALANDGAAKPGADGSKRVCRNLVLTGSRMTKRHCRSQAEWDADAERARRDLQNGQLYGNSRDGQQIPNK